MPKACLIFKGATHSGRVRGPLQAQAPQNPISPCEKFPRLTNLVVFVSHDIEHFSLLLGPVVGGKVCGILEIDFIVDHKSDIDSHGEKDKENLKDQGDKNGHLPLGVGKSLPFI